MIKFMTILLMLCSVNVTANLYTITTSLDLKMRTLCESSNISNVLHGTINNLYYAKCFNSLDNRLKCIIGFHNTDKYFLTDVYVYSTKEDCLLDYSLMYDLIPIKFKESTTKEIYLNLIKKGVL